MAAKKIAPVICQTFIFCIKQPQKINFLGLFFQLTPIYMPFKPQNGRFLPVFAPKTVLISFTKLCYKLTFLAKVPKYGLIN